MQVVCLDRVVPESPKLREPQENFTIPRSVDDALRPMWERIGRQAKWQAYVAAILAFYRMTEEEQNRAMDDVVAARRRNNFTHLLVRDIGRTEGNEGEIKQRPATEAQASRDTLRRGKSKRPAHRGARTH